MPATIRPLFPPLTSLVHIAADGASLVGELTIPDRATALAVFAYTNAGSLGGRDNRRLARALRHAGYATLLFDLLSPDEEMLDARTHTLSGDLPLLSRRLIETIDWLGFHDATADFPIGLVGEGTGAAAAFVAACVRPTRVGAIVSIAEHPDIASPVLGRVHAPTLLIVPGNSAGAVRANDLAFQRMHVVRELVRLASPASPVARTIDDVSRLMVDWFEQHLPIAVMRRQSLGEPC